MKSRSISNYLVLAMKGFCMGAADVVPGVSGGTMALILGIYEELIKAIHSFNFNFLRLITLLKIREALSSVSWPFLLAVGIGILLAIFSLARALSWLLDNYPVIIWSFFFGLILSSVFTVGRVVKKWRIPTVIAIGLGTIAAYFLFGLIPVATPEAPWFIFLSGFFAICAMILPGISGAYILVLLGKYHYILDAVNNRDILTLLILTAGALVGILSSVRVIGWLLKRYHDLTMAILIGLMLGSLRRMWPWKDTLTTNTLPPCLNIEIGIALLFMFFGFLVIFSLDFWERKKN